MREGLVSFRRQIPGAAELVQQFIVKRHEPKMFPEPIRVISLCGHQFIPRTEVEAAGVQQPCDHRCSRAMCSGNADRCLDVSAIFHSKTLHNDGPRSASSRLLRAERRSLAVGTGSFAPESHPTL